MDGSSHNFIIRTRESRKKHVYFLVSLISAPSIEASIVSLLIYYIDSIRWVASHLSLTIFRWYAIRSALAKTIEPANEQQRKKKD